MLGVQDREGGRRFFTDFEEKITKLHLIPFKMTLQDLQTIFWVCVSKILHNF